MDSSRLRQHDHQRDAIDHGHVIRKLSKLYGDAEADLEGELDPPSELAPFDDGNSTESLSLLEEKRVISVRRPFGSRAIVFEAEPSSSWIGSPLNKTSIFPQRQSNVRQNA
jgi:hypothetical protein